MEKHYKMKKSLQIQGFKEWLATLGYASSTVYSFPLQLEEYLDWLENEKRANNKESALLFMDYFKNRKHKRKAGGLSIAHINKQIDVLNKYFEYLYDNEKIKEKIRIDRLLDKEIPQRKVLTKAQIQSLYAATENDIFGIRDRAMLSVYYGCGLRRKEGLDLELSDIILEQQLLRVRRGKNGYERYVPMSKNCCKDLENYLVNVRPYLLKTKSNESVFISERGTKLSDGAMIHRLKKLQIKAELNEEIGLHTLRHSIATHLLQSGMSLEHIALFLGHRSLDSTQIYTHLKSIK